MKVAVVGSRSLEIDDLERYLPEGIQEIVSGGATGIDTSAKKYAMSHGLKLTEFLPNYEKYGRAAPILRNNEIIDYADMVVVLWDGKSNGTKYVITECAKRNKAITIYEF